MTAFLRPAAGTAALRPENIPSRDRRSRVGCRFSQRAAWPLMLCAALAGCSLAPDYERPAAPVAAAWPDVPELRAGQEGRAPDTLGRQPAAGMAGQPAAELGWREFFRDPRLQKLIELSLANNRDLREAIGRVQEARAQYGVQRGEQFPSIGVGAQGERQHLPRDLRPGGPDSTSISSTYQAGVGLTAFEIDLFGRLRNLSEAARQQYLATEQARRSVQINLIGQVAQAYLTLRAAEVQLDLTQKTLDSRRASYDLVRRRYDGGVASELELNQAKGLLDSASADLAQLARLQAQARNALVLLVGQPLPADLPAPAPFDRDQLVAGVPAGLPSDLLERRPDIVAAEHQLMGANASIGAARAAFFPTISLTGSAGTASSSLSGLFDAGSGMWVFSPQITMPLFAGGSIRAGVDLAEARNNIAVAQYERAIQQAFQEVSDALAGEATYGAQLDAQRALQASSARTLELSNLRYENGIDSFLQVQTAQVDFFSAQLALVQTGLDSLINRIELYKALGGGWNETTPDEREPQAAQ